MKTKLFYVVLAAFIILTGFTRIPGAADDDVTLQLPSGFQSSVIIPELGKNRHMVVHSNGDIYVKFSNVDKNGGIAVLRDANKDGKYEIVNSFGDYGGTGIAIKGKYLYASSNEAIFRYTFNDKNEINPADKPETLVTGLLNKRTHESKSIALDNAGNIYVNIGAPSNACQAVDRTKGSPGMDPCPILETAGGIWQFKADKFNQSYPEGVRYVTGIRNVVGLDWNNQNNELYIMQHGRDQLSMLYPEMYTDEQSAELPAEEFFLAKKGSNFGWPYCYYDQYQKKKILAPEYGGDSKKQGRCEGVDTPIMAFPGHWAPNALLFYTGNQFPEKYKNGAFIAFHGSWNRAPKDQQGYKVVFVPLGKDGKPSGDYEVFASGFPGADVVKNPRDAKFRPCGLAQGPDGSLYISDSVKGRIWKISYKKS
jgi:glucose/arabinose dehydrogenase